jgi:hypothetical protein
VKDRFIGFYEFVPLGTGGTVRETLTGYKLIILMESIRDSDGEACDALRKADFRLNATTTKDSEVRAGTVPQPRLHQG